MAMGIEAAARRGFEHDVVHQVSTVALLAELIRDASDVDSECSMRARQLVVEARWLQLLLRTQRFSGYGEAASDPPRQIRLDLAVRDLLATTGLLSTSRIRLETEPVAVRAHRIDLGRALRNLIWNALAATGPGGEVAVHVLADGPSAVVRIDDNGPGLGQIPDDTGSTGLSVVREVVSAAGGVLRMENRVRGCTVTLTLPLHVPQGAPCAS